MKLFKESSDFDKPADHSWDKVTNETKTELSKLHSTMKAKGYIKKSYRQSAMELHDYHKPGEKQRSFQYDGHHGTGTGNRFYGPGKKMLGFWKSNSGSPTNIVDSHSKRIFNGERKGGLSDDAYKAHREAWKTVHDYVEKNA